MTDTARDTADAPPMARPRMAAGLLVRDPQGRILLVRPTYKQGWDIPGGYVEPGESPAQAAAREVVEELGVPLVVGSLLVVDWAPHPNEGDKLLFVFDGGQLEDVSTVKPDGEEIAEAAFFRIDDLDGHMPERLSRRLRLAAERPIASILDNYAEHGARRTPTGTPTQPMSVRRAT